MTIHDDEDERKPVKRRPRSPRIKPVPEEMRDPRHDPDAALAEIRAVLKAGGRPVPLDKARAWLGRVDLRHFETEIDPRTGEARGPERAARDKDGRPRFRDPDEKHGPGRLKMRSEQAIEQVEADFARAVKEVEQVSTLLGWQSTAASRSASLRSRKGTDIAERVCQLYDALSLPARNRASVITLLLARDGHAITVQRVRQILAVHRPGPTRK